MTHKPGVNLLPPDEAERWRRTAETILLAPYMGAAAPYIYHSACMELGHPLTPRGDDCRCGDVKKGRVKYDPAQHERRAK